jgi:hypothetical protein
MIEIKNRYTNDILLTVAAENLRDANLRNADLSGADLSGADLRDAKLYRADLSGADLSGADLRDADLYGADLSGEKLAIQPIFISGLYWNITITELFLTIGCKRFKHEEWAEFDDETILSMAINATKFWSVNKSWLLLACKEHRAESLAYREVLGETK